MSISNFQEKVINGGCGKAIMLLSAFAMIFVGYSSCNRASNLAAVDEKGNKARAFASVGNSELAVAWVDEFVDQQTKSNPGMMDALPVSFKVGMYGQAISQLVQQSHLYELATRNGYKPSDEQLLKDLKIDTQANFAGDIKKRLVEGKVIKDNATEKEFEDKVKELTQGKTIADVYREQKEQVDKVLKDTLKRPLAIMGFSQNFLTKKFESEMNPTDDQIKAGFDTFDFKQILVNTSDKVTEAQAKEKIEKAAGELKTGKSFETAMNEYSDAEPTPGKSKSDSVNTLQRSQLEGTPDFKSLLDLKVGDVSQPLKTPMGGYVLFKLIGKKSDIPKDFNEKKADYRKAFIQGEVERKIAEEVKKVEKDVKPRFELPAFEAAYEFTKLNTSASQVNDQLVTDLQRILEIAKKVPDNDPNIRLAVETSMAALDRLFENPKTDRSKFKDQRIEVVSKYLNYTDNWTYRSELIDAYKDQKDGDKAFNAVLVALEKNAKYDQLGQQNYSDISGKFLELKNAGLIKPDQETQFKAKQAQWQTEKKTYDEMVAREKKLQEEEAKKAAEQAIKANKK